MSQRSELVKNVAGSDWWYRPQIEVCVLNNSSG